MHATPEKNAGGITDGESSTSLIGDHTLPVPRLGERNVISHYHTCSPRNTGDTPHRGARPPSGVVRGVPHDRPRATVPMFDQRARFSEPTRHAPRGRHAADGIQGDVPGPGRVRARHDAPGLAVPQLDERARPGTPPRVIAVAVEAD